MEEMRLEKLREKGYDVHDEASERARADREAAALRSPHFPPSLSSVKNMRILHLCLRLDNYIYVRLHNRLYRDIGRNEIKQGKYSFLLFAL